MKKRLSFFRKFWGNFLKISKFIFDIACLTICCMLLSYCQKRTFDNNDEMSHNERLPLNNEKFHFEFKKEFNPKLNENIVGIVKNNTVFITVEYGTNIAHLKPSIYFKGNSITPPATERQNFADNIVYKVTTENGTIKTYQINVRYRKSTF